MTRKFLINSPSIVCSSSQLAVGVFLERRFWPNGQHWPDDLLQVFLFYCSILLRNLLPWSYDTYRKKNVGGIPYFLIHNHTGT